VIKNIIYPLGVNSVSRDKIPLFNNLHLTELKTANAPYICTMNIQTLLVFLLFAVALVYVGRLVYKSLQVKKDGCGGNCKCGVDFSDIKPVKK